MIMGLRTRVATTGGVVVALVLGTLSLTAVVAPSATAAQPVPGHTRLVPEIPRNNTPRISTGEIWDIEVIPQLNRVFIVGGFTSLANTTGNTATVNQRYLASYNLTTGLIDTAFRPTFNGGVYRGRGVARRHQAVRRRHVQHGERGRAGRRSRASTSRPGHRSQASPSPRARTTRSPRSPPPTRPSTSAAGSPGSTAF